MSKVVPCMWFNGDAEEAAKFYVSLVPNSEITHVQRNVTDSSSGKAGSVLVVEFTVAGQPLVALNGGMKMEYTNALSLMIHCDDQAQVDSVWNAFLAHGGKAQQCGWLNDRYGVSWQVVPKVMFEFLSSPDRAAAARGDASDDEDGQAGSRGLASRIRGQVGGVMSAQVPVGWAKALLRRGHRLSTTEREMVGTLALCPPYETVPHVSN